MRISLVVGLEGACLFTHEEIMKLTSPQYLNGTTHPYPLRDAPRAANAEEGKRLLAAARGKLTREGKHYLHVIHHDEWHYIAAAVQSSKVVSAALEAANDGRGVHPRPAGKSRHREAVVLWRPPAILVTHVRDGKVRLYWHASDLLVARSGVTLFVDHEPLAQIFIRNARDPGFYVQRDGRWASPALQAAADDLGMGHLIVIDDAPAALRARDLPIMGDFKLRRSDNGSYSDPIAASAQLNEADERIGTHELRPASEHRPEKPDWSVERRTRQMKAQLSDELAYAKSEPPPPSGLNAFAPNRSPATARVQTADQTAIASLAGPRLWQHSRERLGRRDPMFIRATDLWRAQGHKRALPSEADTFIGAPKLARQLARLERRRQEVVDFAASFLKAERSGCECSSKRSLYLQFVEACESAEQSSSTFSWFCRIAGRASRHRSALGHGLTSSAQATSRALARPATDWAMSISSNPMRCTGDSPATRKTFKQPLETVNV